jgi:hypothetical protein
MRRIESPLPVLRLEVNGVGGRGVDGVESDDREEGGEVVMLDSSDLETGPEVTFLLPTIGQPQRCPPLAVVPDHVVHPGDLPHF